MKILLDHNVPHELRSYFPDEHTVHTAQYLDWADFGNGELLRAAIEAGFAVFVTLDKSILDQHEVTSYDIGVVVLATHPATAPHLVDQMDKVIERLPQAASERKTIVVE